MHASGTQPITSLSRPHLTASVLLLRSVCDYARSSGGDLERVLERAGLESTAFEDMDARVPDAALQRVWADLRLSTGDVAGIEFARQAQEGEFGVLDYAVYFSSTAGEAVTRFARFYRLLSDALAIAILTDGEVTRLRRLVRGTQAPEQDAFFVLLCLRLREMCGVEFGPAAVLLEHEPAAQSQLAAVFRCPVHFRAPHSELVFASGDLSRPARAAKPRLVTVLDNHAADLLARLPSTATFLAHARQALVVAIRRGTPTLAAVARELRCSPRTLQRRLTALGTSHQELLGEVRRELGLRYLDSPELSITEIAFLLGYEDAGSFRRSVKKWTGRTPADIRAAH